MKTLIVIPARMESKRLPGKPLIDIAGKTLIQRTYERAKEMAGATVIVATPNREIADHCIQNAMLVVFTSPSHKTGTHRCEEVLDMYEDKFGEAFDCVVDWQCDEPCVDRMYVQMMIDEIVGGFPPPICTLVASISDEELHNPNIAKVVLEGAGDATICRWFSRAPIKGAVGHIGIYAFNPGALKSVSSLRISKYAELESLEQLSWLESFEIAAYRIPKMPPAANTPEDIEELRKEFAK